LTNNTTEQGSAAANVDAATVISFGDEWARFDQSDLDEAELARMFAGYFHVFPWDTFPAEPEGFDMGCGSGRWAKFVAPRVGRLNCLDPSHKALVVARRNLAQFPNAAFHEATADSAPMRKASQDFGYSLGVLHHIPDTGAALRSCTELLKPGAPFLVYLYYRFDNRPTWFRLVWKTSELLRSGISRLPNRAKHLVTDIIAAFIYWPLARIARLGETFGLNTKNVPLYGYRNFSFYTMRTDSRDRFGTPLEQRFTRDEIHDMMAAAGLTDIVVSDKEPYWCAVGTRHE